MDTAPDDRTARARIRDAALVCFARQGFSAPLRVIAAEAGVSVPLITHHYGTKDALRQTCDEHVLTRFVEMKLLAIAEPSSVGKTLDDSSQSSVLMVYMVRCFLEATDSARSFFEKYVDRLRQIIEASREKGLVNPSVDEEERLHVLATQSLGSLLVEFVVNPPQDPMLFVDQVYSPRQMVAFMELYSQPFFTSSPTIDSYRTAIRERDNHD